MDVRAQARHLSDDMNIAPPSLPARYAGTVLAIIVASYLMIVVDISIVITGLPRIQDSLGFTAAQLSWVTNAYTLTFGGLLLLGARACASIFSDATSCCCALAG